MKKIFWGTAFFLFVRIVYLALRRRSFNTRLKISRRLASIAYKYWGDGRERIIRNLSFIRPDLSDTQITRGSKRAAATIARSWAAMLGNESTTLEEIADKLKVEGIEQLLDYHRRGEKVIATAVHVGPIDEMLGIIPIFGLQTYIPAEAVNPKWYFNLMMRLRLRFDGITLEAVNKGETLTKAAHHLSNGKIVVLVVDIDKRDGSGVICRIGDGMAMFPVGAVKLALEQNATIFPILPSWGENGKNRIVVSLPFELIRMGDLNDEIEINTRRLIEGVYAPHIQEHWYDWLRVLWIDLKPAS